ncbi:MAG: hypothetical protein HQK82_08230 [Desulfovibrionaceae bacterium]|nr:hypothetical protein [Desulfovibrionaceae bacterium]
MRKDADSAVTGQMEAILESVLFAFEGKPAEVDEIIETVEDYDDSGDLPVLSLTLNEQLRFIEHHAEDYDTATAWVEIKGSPYDLTANHSRKTYQVPFDLTGIRSVIEANANWTICSRAKSELASKFHELKPFFGQNGLDQGILSSTNPFGWVAHRSETWHDAHGCTVYHYQGVEGDVNVDVLELRLFKTPVYVIMYL